MLYLELHSHQLRDRPRLHRHHLRDLPLSLRYLERKRRNGLLSPEFVFLHVVDDNILIELFSPGQNMIFVDLPGRARDEGHGGVEQADVVLADVGEVQEEVPIEGEDDRNQGFDDEHRL